MRDSLFLFLTNSYSIAATLFQNATLVFDVLVWCVYMCCLCANFDRRLRRQEKSKKSAPGRTATKRVASCNTKAGERRVNHIAREIEATLESRQSKQMLRCARRLTLLLGNSAKRARE